MFTMKSHRTLKSLIERNKALPTSPGLFQPRHQPFHQAAASLRLFPCRLPSLAQKPSQRARDISSSVSSRSSISNSSGPLSSTEPSEESVALPAPNPSDQEFRSPSGGLASISTPAYELSITCKPKAPLPDCGYRSTHRISKQGYFKGTILVQCPKCGNRHLIADHLKVSASLFV